MKLSTYYKALGFNVMLSKEVRYLKAHQYFASAIFSTSSTMKKIVKLRNIYGDEVDIGGTGMDISRKLPPEIEACFPDYSLYDHTHYALGFLTRGCPKKCDFCIVPAKEGKLEMQTESFSGFVPPGWQNIMLLDNNLLGYANAHELLEEMVVNEYKVNFSQTLDIAYLDQYLYPILLKINSQNSRFTRKRIYFSLNHPGSIRQFEIRKSMLKGFGKDMVSVVAMYGFDTSLSGDYARWMMLRRLGLVTFFQEYWPIGGVAAQLPEPYFDMDLDEVIRLTFRSNGINWEKYLRWLNRLYFKTFGRYYQPLIETIYRYNNKTAIQRYLKHPGTLTSELYHSYL